MPETSTNVGPSIVAKALSHPLRVEILTILDTRIASPSELAAEWDVSLGVLSYHVDRLYKTGFLELVRTRPVRGAVEHFYRAIRRPYFHDEDWRQLPPAARRAISGSAVQIVVDDIDESLTADVFDKRDDRHLSRTPLTLDEQAWKKMNGLLNELVGKGLDLQAEAVERMRESGEPGIKARMILLGFEAAGDEKDRD